MQYDKQLNTSSTFINIQEVHALYEAQGFQFSELTTVRPPYPQCVLAYQPDRGLAIVSVVTETGDSVQIESFASVQKGPLKPFLRASVPVSLSMHPDIQLEIRHDPNIRDDVAAVSLGKVLFALNLMICRNIKYTPFNPNATLGRKKKRSRMRKNAEPYLTYKILQIQPMKKRVVTKEERQLFANSQPLHTVRGHFKTYTSENPLFGKLTGTFWWGPCAKGNPEIGIVEKDYRLLIEPDELRQILTTERGDGRDTEA